MNTLRWICYVFRYGEWSAGCEFWEGKPLLDLVREYYNGWLYVLHVGPFWVECDYYGRPRGDRMSNELLIIIGIVGLSLSFLLRVLSMVLRKNRGQDEKYTRTQS